VNIFISHSRRDKELVERIRTIITNIGHQSIVEEFIPTELKQPIPYAEIKSKVDLSSLVFLFLTDNVVLTEYTRNWVMFEISLAATQQKRLFVFERQGTPIPYPIPYLTDYMIFNNTTESLLTIQGVTREAGQIPTHLITGGIGILVGAPFGPLGILLGGIGGLILGANQLQPTVPRIICPHCRIPFNYYSPQIATFACPSCRQWIQLRSKIITVK